MDTRARVTLLLMKLNFQGWSLVFVSLTASASAFGFERNSDKPALFRGDRKPAILAPPEYATESGTGDTTSRTPVAPTGNERDSSEGAELPSADAI